MDRISAIRNVEDALRAYEAGECDLATLESEVGTVLRSYATEFEDDDRRAYRAIRPAGRDEGDGSGDDADGDGSADADGVARVAGRVVVAASPADARERLCALTGVPADADFEIEAL